jgi:hypothetical protein
MKIVLLGLSSDDLGSSLRKMQVAFGDALQSALDDARVVAAIETIFITPVIARPGIGPFPEKLSYLRSEPAVNVSVNVPYEQWMNGARRDHVNLVAAAVTDSIGRIKASKLGAPEKAAILECVERVRRQLTDN